MAVAHGRGGGGGVWLAGDTHPSTQPRNSSGAETRAVRRSRSPPASRGPRGPPPAQPAPSAKSPRRPHRVGSGKVPRELAPLFGGEHAVGMVGQCGGRHGGQCRGRCAGRCDGGQCGRVVFHKAVFHKAASRLTSGYRRVAFPCACVLSSPPRRLMSGQPNLAWYGAWWVLRRRAAGGAERGG